MKTIKLILWLFVLAFGLGITVLGLPQTVNAQTDKAKHEKEQEDDDDENLSTVDKKQVKINMDEARAIALKRVSGTIVEEELEKEKGRLQYAFDIKDSERKVWDVEIDAITGEVLQAEEDDEDGDDKDTSQARKKNIFVSAGSKVKRTVTLAVAKIF